MCHILSVPFQQIRKPPNGSAGDAKRNQLSQVAQYNVSLLVCTEICNTLLRRFRRVEAHTAPQHPQTRSYWCPRHCLCCEAPSLAHPQPHIARPLQDRASPRPLTAISPDTKDASPAMITPRTRNDVFAAALWHPTRSEICSAVLRSTRQTSARCVL